MAPTLLVALALFATDPAPGSAGQAPWPAGAPTDDYGLVAWCYGALNSHMKLHDQVMPEVERIERQWERTPGSAKEALAAYHEQQIEGVRAIAQFRRTMESAEKASVKPIQMDGAEAIKKGAAIWTGAATTDRRRLAQEWMSWALPVRCLTTAKALEQRANLLGQALDDNAQQTPPPAVATPVSASQIGLRGIGPSPEPEPQAAPEPQPEPEPQAAPEPADAVRADFVVDMDDPQPCPGRLEPTTRDGKAVLVCKAQ